MNISPGGSTPEDGNNTGAYKLSLSNSGDDMTLGDSMLLNCAEEPQVTKHPWEELEQIERTRRALLKRAELPFWRILAFWNGTCLKALALDWLVWVPITIFVAIRIHAHQGKDNNDMPEMAEMLGTTDTDILGGFLSFLLVIFVNQTNSRFFEMYKLAKKSSGQVQDVAGLVSTQFPKAAAHRLVRYMNAAQVAGYVGLGGPYTKCQFFDVINQNHHLLDTSELKQVEYLDMDSGSAVFKELVTWCQRDIGRAQKAGYINSFEASQLHNHVLMFRGAMDGIYDYCDQPTHFFYIHFLCLLSALYLPIFAVDNAFSAGWGQESCLSIEILTGTIVLLQSFFVVGLRLLAQKMVDPFGDDLEDLSVMTYVLTTIENTRIILNAQEPKEDVDESFENKLRRDEKIDPAAFNISYSSSVVLQEDGKQQQQGAPTIGEIA